MIVIPHGEGTILNLQYMDMGLETYTMLTST